MSSETGRAFQVSQAAISASKFVSVVDNRAISPVTIKYPHNENEAGCFYREYEKTIYVVGNRLNDNVQIDGKVLRSYASWDVIQHEFFHHVQSEFDIEDNHGGWHGSDNMYVHYLLHIKSPSNEECEKCIDSEGKFDCITPKESLVKEYAIKLTYAEAAASVLSGISQDYFVNTTAKLDSNIKTVGDMKYTSYNGSAINYEMVTESSGEVGESSSIAVLWDIFDSYSETFDAVSLGYQKIWNAIIKNNNKTLSEFYKNNSFIIVFYNQYKYEIFRKNVTSTSYTLSESEWNSILQESGDVFYWNIGAMQNDGYACTTGPYYSNYKLVTKPAPVSIIESEHQSGNIIE